MERNNFMARWYRFPVCTILIERFGDDDHVVTRLAIIESIGIVVGSIAKRIEVAAIGERGCKTQWLLDAIAGHHVGQCRECALGRSEGVNFSPGAEDRKKDGFGIGCPDA